MWEALYVHAGQAEDRLEQVSGERRKMIVLTAIGSITSILGLGVSLYVLWRELRIETEVLDLTEKEKRRHDK